MTTNSQLAANRANALKSTGPRTAEGKQQASRNAVTHGVWAAAPVIPGEDPAAWEAHRSGILASLTPVGLLEQTLADRVALLLWRLHRLSRYETLTTAADIEAGLLPGPASDLKLDQIAAGQGAALDRAVADTRRKAAATRKRLAAVRPAAEQFSALIGGPDEQPMLAAVAAPAVRTGYDLLHHYELRDDPPGPNGRLLKRLGRDEDRLSAVPWTAGLVRHAFGVYAAFVNEPAEWLVGQVAVQLVRDRDRLTREYKRLAGYAAGLVERRRRSAAWAAASLVMPAAGRDERIARYEAHLQKSLTATLQELERLRGLRAIHPGSANHGAGASVDPPIS